LKWSHHIFVLILALVPIHGWAEEDSGLYEIVVEVGPDSGVEDDAPTVSGVDRPITTIRASAPSAAELLHDVQGVEVRHSGAAGQSSTLSIRGSDGQQSQVQIDGIPVGALLGGGADLSLLPVWGLKKVRILRGGLSDRAGSDALGGLIDVQSRAPGARKEARAAARIGSFGYGGVDGLIGLGSEAISGRLIFSIMHSEGAFPFLDQHGQAAVRENADSARNQVMLNLAARPSGWGRLRATQLTTQIKRGIPGPAQFPTPNARQEATHLLTSLHWSGNPRRGLKIFHSAAHRLERSHYWDLSPNLDSTGEQRAVMHQALGRLGLIWFPTSAHELSMETEGRADLGRIQNAGQDALNLSEHRIALALRDTWSVGDWVFYAGVRAERWSEEALEWAPRVGLRWSFVRREEQNQSLRLGFGRAYRVPSLSERYVDLGSIRGNPDLSPETGWSADLSWSLDIKSLTIEVTPFVTYYQNSILFLPQSLYVVQAENARDALAFGVESSIAVALPHKHRLVLGHTFARARFLDPDISMPGRPEHSGHLTLTGRNGSLEHEFLLRGRSAVTLDRFGGITEEGHLWFDANLAWSHSAFTLIFRAQNIFDDRNAVDHLQQALPGRSFFLVLDMGGAS
jgi:outer membrane cobalamin receptor